MPIGPSEFLDVLDHAIAERRRNPVLELRVPTLWGEHGKRLPEPDDDGHTQYGYTRRQCKRLRAVVIAAIQSDLATHPRTEDRR